MNSDSQSEKLATDDEDVSSQSFLSSDESFEEKKKSAKKPTPKKSPNKESPLNKNKKAKTTKDKVILGNLPSITPPTKIS